MPYIANIPQPTDRIKDSQPQILGNFTAVPTLLEINHVGFTGGADEGKHIKVDFTESATHPLTAATQILVYNYVNPTTTVNELYVKKAGALAVAGIPMTASLDAQDGWSYLPSGILIKWGAANITGDQVIQINAVAPLFTALYNVQVTAQTNGFADTNKAVVLRQILSPGTAYNLQVSGVERLTATDANITCYWVAIGV